MLSLIHMIKLSLSCSTALTIAGLVTISALLEHIAVGELVSQEPHQEKCGSCAMDAGKPLLLMQPIVEDAASDALMGNFVLADSVAVLKAKYCATTNAFQR